MKESVLRRLRLPLLGAAFLAPLALAAPASATKYVIDLGIVEIGFSVCSTTPQGLEVCQAV